MLTLNQTVGTNNQAIWVIKINTPTPIYVATRDVTLDNTYDGQVLNFNNYLSDINQTSTIKEGGGTGAVASFGFSISRYNRNTNLDGFMNEFYPSTAGVYLTGVIVSVGIVWEGATADTDITWLMSGRIVDYGYKQRVLNITVFQESEITNKELPYYSVQKDFDNGISYFAYAPKESYGLIIPIAYGDLTIGAQIFGYIDTRLDYGNLSPCIKTSNATGSYIVTSHECHTVSADNVLWGDIVAVVYYYIASLLTYMAVYNRTDTGDSYSNTNSGYSFATQSVRGVDNLKGFCRIKLIVESKDSDVDTNLVANEDVTDYVEIDNNEICALKMAGTASTGDIGFLSGLNTYDVQIVFVCSNDGAGTYNLEISYNNYTQSSSGGGIYSGSVSTESPVAYEIGLVTTAKKDSLAWTIEELSSLDYLITNKSGTGGNDIRVYYAFIQLDNIFVQTRNQARNIRNEIGGRNA